ncbi:MAG: hypothetical protein H6706_24580 [Myxococcales bacterium]|nr:hypothetical protein [Myxococcales bacterium]
MADGAPSLSTILDGSVPVLGNRDALEAVATTRGRPALALALGPRAHLDAAFVPALYEVLSTLGSDAFDVFLGPLGPAAPDVGRIVGLLADRGRFEALIPLEASPAATLVAFAADRIWLGPAGTLAPLLPADAPDGTARALLELLAAAPADARPAALARFWGGYDPATLGAAIRHRHDVVALARRCLRQGGTPADLIGVAAARFTAIEEPDLPLALADCRALGLPAQAPGPGLHRALVALRRYYDRMLALEGEMTHDQKRYVVTYDGFIDTPTERRILLRVTRTDEHGRPRTESPTAWRWVRPSDREIAIDQVLEL